MPTCSARQGRLAAKPGAAGSTGQSTTACARTTTSPTTRRRSSSSTCKYGSRVITPTWFDVPSHAAVSGALGTRPPTPLTTNYGHFQARPESKWRSSSSSSLVSCQCQSNSKNHHGTPAWSGHPWTWRVGATSSAEQTLPRTHNRRLSSPRARRLASQGDHGIHHQRSRRQRRHLSRRGRPWALFAVNDTTRMRRSARPMRGTMGLAAASPGFWRCSAATRT